MLTYIHVQFIFDSLRLGLSQMSPSELSSCCFGYVLSHYFA